MAFELNDIRDNDGARKGRMRVGRGIGSGKGKTAGRGQKGQKSREGGSIKGFEGGQMPLHMRLPKRGFNNPFGKDYAEVNLGQLQKLVDAGTLATDGTIDHAALKAAGVARGGKDGVRVLAKGAVTSALTLNVAGASAAAKAAVEAAGGSLQVIEVTPAADKHKAKHRVVQKAKAEDKAAKKAANA
jgi:large subunit ribosomal protein L15